MSSDRKYARLLAVWLLLAVLVIIIVIVERPALVGSRSRRSSHAPGSSAARLLLPIPVHQLGAIELVYAGTLHRFQRNATGAWFYHGVHAGSEGIHTHDADAALAQRIADTFAAFGRTQIERRFSLETQATDYGITAPELLILAYLPNDAQPIAQYVIGDIAPDTLSRYVHVIGSAAVVTIANYQIDNLLTLIEGVASKSGRDAATRSSP